MKMKFRNHGYGMAGDYFEKNIKINGEDCYILISEEGSNHRKPKSYYIIDIQYVDFSTQIRDYSIKTKRQAIQRVKKELLNYNKKQLKGIKDFVDSIEIV